MLITAQLLKNLTCISFCLSIIFITSIFVSETYYNESINSQIQKVSLLKDIHYLDWALMQSPSTIIHQFQAYSYNNMSEPVLINQSMKYQYTYQYEDISFSQGNTGNVQYINHWKRTYIDGESKINSNSNFTHQDQVNLTVVNVDAQKVYNYDFYAPDSRKFALMYNVMFDMLSKDFLNNFYGQYLFEYFFKTSKMVQNKVFAPMNIKEEDGLKIYNNFIYGFSNPIALNSWIKLSQEIAAKSYYLSSFYAGIRENLKLSDDQILFIAGPASTLRNMLLALKGSLKYKLSSRQYSYECETQFCSKQVLAASQLAFGMLTKQPIFQSLSLDLLVNELNTTIYSSIEYSDLCFNTANLTCLDQLSTLSFFVNNYLSNFTQVDFIFHNFDKPEILEDRYQFDQGTGLSIVLYVKHLYQKVFNLNTNHDNPNTNQDNLKTINAQANSNAIEDQIDYKPLMKSFTNYNNLQKIIKEFQNLLYVELHTRAFSNMFISEKVKCEDYYSGVFEEYKADCNYVALNISRGIQSVRNYINAYLGLASPSLMKFTSIPANHLYDFFHNVQLSLFARQVQQLKQDLVKEYACEFGCSSSQLLVKQLADGSILSNLPIDYFNGKKEQSILNWDYLNVLNGFEPQLYKIGVKVTQGFQAGILLNSIQGVYSLFNLMKLSAADPNATMYKGIKNADLLYYIQSVILNIKFDGIFLKKQLKSFFNGYDSQIIKNKQKQNNTLGGASWLNSNISVIQLEHKPKKFNSINSGIYNTQKLRTLSSVQGSQYSSSEYIIFNSEFQDVKTVFKSDKKVKGTNLLGFNTKIQQFDTIQGYFDMIYQSQPLAYQNTLIWKNADGQQITAFQFKFANVDQDFSISVQEQADHSVKMLPQSYFIVQPQTGLTLQMEIKYVVSTEPFFLSLIPSLSNKKLPLYLGEISYNNLNTAQIVQLNKDKNQLSLFFLLGIIFTSISVLGFVIGMILYIRKVKIARKDQRRGLLGNINRTQVRSRHNQQSSEIFED